MTDRIELSLSPTGGNAVGRIRVTGEVIDFHTARARRLRAESLRDAVLSAWRSLAGLPAVKVANDESTDCRDAAWLARG